MKKQVDNHKLQLDTLTAANRDLESELKEKVDKIANLNDQHQKATYQIQDLERQLEQERNNLKEMAAQHEFELKEKDKANELMKLQAQLEETQTAMNQESTQMSDQLEQRDRIINELKEKMSKHIEEFQAKDRELYEKELKITNLTQIGDKCEVLQTENQQMRTQLQQKDDKIEELNSDIKKLNSKAQNLEERCQKIHQELSVTQGTLFEAEKRRDFFWEKGHEIKKLCQDKEIIIERLSKELKQIKTNQIPQKACTKCAETEKSKKDTVTAGKHKFC